jgi:hypothetical protein
VCSVQGSVRLDVLSHLSLQGGCGETHQLCTRMGLMHVRHVTVTPSAVPPGCATWRCGRCLWRTSIRQPLAMSGHAWTVVLKLATALSIPAP